tara:strand:+ start:122 stop:1072 length:951 start_codon:yes stop_codon:yes gene_type:complete
MSVEKETFWLNPHGDSKTKRLTVPSAEEILYQPFPVLDHGFVRLVDYMGGDYSIGEAARVSYGKGTRSVREEEGLIRFLMRHRHTTPTEMVELKFHAKMPIFVARQWIRHRTANVNEYSARYSILDNEFYVPDSEDLAEQSKSNRQGRENLLSSSEAERVRRLLIDDAETNYEHYLWLLNEDSESPGKPKDPNRGMLARELARMDLTLNFYTQWYWKVDLHNLFNFLGLRMDPHAQKEIRGYANKMAEITEAVAPISFKAFEDYRLNSISLSALEINALASINSGKNPRRVISQVFKNGRERTEFKGKLEKLGIKS